MPEIVVLVMLTAADPVLVSETVWIALLPVATLPKLKLDALGARFPLMDLGGSPPEGLTMRAQLPSPTDVSKHAKATRTRKRVKQRGFVLIVVCFGAAGQFMPS